jgi:hypothetical protein
LDQAWQESRRELPGWRRLLGDNGLWLLLLGAGFVMLLVMQIGVPGRSRRRGKRDE